MYSRLLWQLAVALPFTFAVVVGFTDSKRVFAQLTPDNTLGTENSIVTPQELRDLIQGGAIRDSALFHSFDEFNVGSDRGVFFDLQNNTDILNIFTRVTGGNVSNILGTLGVLQDALNSDVLGNANLFLLNPNGITFGGNANLQLNGSFFATTADGFGFEDFTFSASGEEAPPPLLTISIPRFLDFRNNAGNIAVNQSNLSVNQGQNLSLVGGNVNVNNANLTANGGTIQIAGLSGNGSVDLSQGGFSNNLNIGFADTTIFNSGSVTINESEIFATATALGGEDNIVLDAVEEISLTNNSILNSEGDWGVIRLGSYITPNTITVNNSTIAAENNTEVGLAGDIYLNATYVNLANRSTLSTNGSSGRIFVDASERINLTNSTLTSNGNFGVIQLGSSVTPNTININSSQITAQESTGFGFAGDVFFDAIDVAITDSNININGDSGRIFIGNLRSTETVTIDNSTLSTDSTQAAQNSPQFQIFAGNINIDSSEEISITNSTLSSNGNFGVIDLGFIVTPNTITINNSQITAQENTGEGLAGDVFFNATDVAITDSNVNINGDSGRIFIGNLRSTETVTIDNSTLSTDSTEAAQNSPQFRIFAGIITIDASESISLTNSSLSSTGDSGFIAIGEVFADAPETVSISNSSVTTNNTPSGSNDKPDEDNVNNENTQEFDEFDEFDEFAGSITIDAQDSILIENNSSITSNGNIGFIRLGSGNFSVDLNDFEVEIPRIITISQSEIAANNNSVNNQDDSFAGTIQIFTDNLTLDNGQINATTSGGAGNINLTVSDLLLLLNNSQISTSGSVSGEGGDINISARLVVASPEDNDIHADAEGNQAGDVNIKINDESTGFIFGIQERNNQDTPLSDITANSGVEDGDGDISINNQQATDPSQGLIELPEEIADESTFVAGGVCSVGEGSEFIVRGRGGIPYIPGLVTQNDVINIDLVDEVLLPAPPPEAIKPHHRTDVTLINSEGEEYKPAMGAVLLPNGMVEFVDYNPAEVYRDMYAAAGCSRLSNE